jgi:hypothetical protein
VGTKWVAGRHYKKLRLALCALQTLRALRRAQTLSRDLRWRLCRKLSVAQVPAYTNSMQHAAWQHAACNVTQACLRACDLPAGSPTLGSPARQRLLEPCKLERSESDRTPRKACSVGGDAKHTHAHARARARKHTPPWSTRAVLHPIPLRCGSVHLSCHHHATRSTEMHRDTLADDVQT